MYKINQAWTHGLKGEEAKKMQELVVSNKFLLDRLVEILYNMQEKRESSVLADYDTPSWSHKQAHLNGEAAMIRKLADLIEVKERDDHPTKGA